MGEALRQTFMPDVIVDFATITTIVGGTVGGYITYSGAHRLLDKGLVGEENLAAVTRASLTGIAVTGVMRFVLFLPFWALSHRGDAGRSSRWRTPPRRHSRPRWAIGACASLASCFWAAAITSVIGAAYTSVSFLTVFTI